LIWQPGQGLPASFYKEQRNKKGFQLEKHGREGTLNFSLFMVSKWEKKWLYLRAESGNKKNIFFEEELRRGDSPRLDFH
jgi:hypothetical protein